MLVMHFLPDDGEKLELLKAISKRLKPGATFILADGFLDNIDDPQESDWLMDAYQKHALLNGAPEEIVEQAVRMIRDNVNLASDAREVDLLREAGFAALALLLAAIGVYGVL
jgi:tRNA (cmo5U34)-methyltransferase